MPTIATIPSFSPDVVQDASISDRSGWLGRWTGWTRLPAQTRLPLLMTVMGSLLAFGYTLGRYGQAGSTADGCLYYAHARSWYFDGDCDYANDLQADPKLTARDFYLARRSPLGLVRNEFPVGWSLLAFPFVVLADGLTVAHNHLFGSNLERDGFSVYYRVLTPLPHVLLALAGLFAAYAIAARRLSPASAAWATFLGWNGTNVVYFAAMEPTMAHAAGFGLVTLLIVQCDRISWFRATYRESIGIGLTAGLMVVVRYQDFVWLLVPIMTGAAMLRSRCKGTPTEPGSPGTRSRPHGASRLGWGWIAVALLTFLSCLTPQLVVNLVVEGTLSGGAERYMPNWLSPHFLRDLFDDRGGLVTLFPVAGVGLAGAGWVMWRDRRAPVIQGLFMATLACMYLSACAGESTSRRFVSMGPVWILGLAAILDLPATVLAKRRAITRRLAGIAVGLVLAFGCAANVLRLILVDRQVLDRYVYTSVLDSNVTVWEGLKTWLTRGSSTLQQKPSQPRDSIGEQVPLVGYRDIGL